MSSNHPSENELQQYAIGELFTNEDVAAHLHSCAGCHARVTNYRLLAQQLNAMQSPAFDFNLAQLMLEQLPAPKAQFSWITVLGVVLTLAFLAAVPFVFGGYIVKLFKNLPALFATVLTVSTVAIFIGQLNTIIKEHYHEIKKLDFN